MGGGAWWVAKSRIRLSDFTFTFHFPALEKEMATHSSVLAWRIPGSGEPGGLPSMGLHRVGLKRLSSSRLICCQMFKRYKLCPQRECNLTEELRKIKYSLFNLDQQKETLVHLSETNIILRNISAAAAAAAAKSFQSCPTLCDLMDSSPPGSPVPGILQARTLERVAISFYT